MTESDSKRIIRDWDREIDEELSGVPPSATRGAASWRIVSWTALWVLWLLLLAALITHGRGLR